MRFAKISYTDLLFEDFLIYVFDLVKLFRCWLAILAQDGKGFDPISFRLEGSMDGNSWYLLNQKAGYSTPEARGALVGPFMVSKCLGFMLMVVAMLLADGGGDDSGDDN